MKNQNWNDILEYVRAHFDEFIKVDVGGYTATGVVRKLLNDAGFEVGDIALDEILETLQQGLVDIAVKSIQVIHPYGAKVWHTVQMSDRPLLTAQIPLWLKEKGYLNESDAYLSQNIPASWLGGWTRHAVVWSAHADDTYFIYIGYGFSQIEGRYVFTSPTERAIEDIARCSNL